MMPASPTGGTALTTFDPSLQDYLEDFATFVLGGKTPDEAAMRYQRLANLSREQAEAIKCEYLRKNARFIELRDPRVLKSNRHIETWYMGPEHPNAWCWPAYKQLLLKKKWNDDDLKSLDDASTKIVAHLAHPSTERFSTRGLVLGYVQSGKTANYSGLIAKAADVGYKLFIVLAGTTSSLRRQTQERLIKDLCDAHPQYWKQLTSPEFDFGHIPGTPDSLLTPDHRLGRVICVIKKNKFILERLEKFLRKANPDLLKSCPTIVIDDEADNASVNTRQAADTRTAINKGIIALLERLPRAAYIGYTATPFANIFINPTAEKDLFPRDFIVDLPRPRAYFGAERIFGREILWHDPEDATFEGTDIVRTVSTDDPDERPALQPAKAAERDEFEPSVPESLAAAFDYFVLATACRYARGDDDQHSSMLVHTSQYVSVHSKLQSVLQDHVDAFRKSWKKRAKALERYWSEEIARTEATRTKGLAADFKSVKQHIDTVLERIEVVVDNGSPGAGLDYSNDRPRVYVAIGGNTLSRGLTLEGLLVSYFVRTASAYDTLLQMGRWFGYRPRYEDLPRVWMTPELEEHFFFLSAVEEEIRLDIRKLELEGKTPAELAIRVRSHPKLQITAKAKMQNVRLVSASFSDRRVQSFLFSKDDPRWIAANVNASRRLLRTVSGYANSRFTEGRWVISQVKADDVVRFLSEYRFHESHEDLRSDLLLKYLESERTSPAKSLERWNVVVMGRDTLDPALGSIDLGLERDVACLNRSRFKTTDPANIKALTSAPDRVADLAEGDTSSEEAMIARRNSEAPGVGLLLLYPISKDSTPERGTRRLCPTCKTEHLCPDKGAAVRHPLQAASHLIGAALVFPKSVRGDNNYVANDLGKLFDSDVVGEGELPELTPEQQQQETEG